MTTNYRVSYSFVKLPDAAIADFTDVVINGMTDNGGFPTPPIAMLNLGMQKTDYLVKLTAAASGGKLATLAKNQAREGLIGSLRKLAAYVQSLAETDLQLMLSSGFQVSSTNRTRNPLNKPVVQSVDNRFNGKLILRVQPVTNARAYEVQYKNGGGWLPAGIFTNSRQIEVGSLTPGQSYTMQLRAIGGSTGYSDWTATEPVIVT